MSQVCSISTSHYSLLCCIFIKTESFATPKCSANFCVLEHFTYTSITLFSSRSFTSPVVSLPLCFQILVPYPTILLLSFISRQTTDPYLSHPKLISRRSLNDIFFLYSVMKYLLYRYIFV